MGSSGPAPYKVQIEQYEGPMDLLLDLIRKQEMDIHNIAIGKITGQYLEYLHKLEELDIDVSAEFIYMAATLILIKSKMLLPPDPLAEDGSAEAMDPRAELVNRLLEHEKFKNAAQMLYQKQQIEAHVWSKPDLTMYDSEETEGELVVNLHDLVRVFQQVLERRKEVVKIELKHDQFTVAQMMELLRKELVASEEAVSLVKFYEGCPTRHAMIVAFLAVLELVKLQAIGMAQTKLFDDIVMRKGKRFDEVFAEEGMNRVIDEQYR